MELLQMVSAGMEQGRSIAAVIDGGDGWWVQR